MRKRNKILMIVVSLLLCLTLISSCFLSSIYARYTKIYDTSTVVQCEAYGVILTLEVDQKLLDACGKDSNNNPLYTLTKNNVTDEVTFTTSSLKLKPGDDFTKMINFTIGGNANVKCKLNIDVDVTYDADNFYIPSTSSGNITYMPIEFCCTYANSGSSVANKTLYNKFVDGPKEDDNVEYVAMNAMLADFNDVKLTGNYDETNHTATDVSIEKIFTPTTSAKPAVQLTYKTGSKTVNQLNFGFKWTDNSNYDVYDTYLVENKTPTFTVSYTISIEQVQSNYTTPAVT